MLLNHSASIDERKTVYTNPSLQVAFPLKYPQARRKTTVEENATKHTRLPEAQREAKEVQGSHGMWNKDSAI